MFKRWANFLLFPSVRKEVFTPSSQASVCSSPFIPHREKHEAGRQADRQAGCTFEKPELCTFYELLFGFPHSSLFEVSDRQSGVSVWLGIRYIHFSTLPASDSLLLPTTEAEVENVTEIHPNGAYFSRPGLAATAVHRCLDLHCVH